MITPHDAWGNPLTDADPRRSSSSDPRDAEIASLKARIAELDAALAAVNAVNKPVTVNKASAARKAYMRDYMRGRRAAQKNNNPTQ